VTTLLCDVWLRLQNVYDAASGEPDRIAQEANRSVDASRVDVATSSLNVGERDERGSMFRTSP
jgi:hypothetical protein